MLVALLGCREVPAPAVVPASLVPSVLHVTWDAPASPWWVEVSLDGGPAVATAPTRGRSLPLLGLKEGRRYEIVAVAGERRGPRVVSPPVTVEVAAKPDLPPFAVEVLDRGRSALAGGFLVTGFMGAGIGADQVVLDGDGDVVWWWRSGDGWDVTQVLPGADGTSFVWGAFDGTAKSDRAEVVEVSVDGTRAHALDTPGAHHVALEPEPGRYARLEIAVLETERRGEPITAGADRVVESDADGSDPVVLFDAFEDLYPDGFHYPCSHTRRSFDRYGVDELTQWTHGNSLVHLPSEDALFVYERFVDTLVKVDRAGGGVVWQMGGPDTDFTLPDGSPTWVSATEPVLWSHGHLTDVWEDGLLIFDNGNHRPTPASRVAMYAFDEAAGTVQETWSHPAPGGVFGDVLGDASRLPNGNVLVSWSTLGRIEELTPEGDVVWRLQGKTDALTARARFFERWDRL